IKKQTHQKGAEQTCHAEVLAPVLDVVLTNDVAVAEPLLQMNFDCHYALSHARSFALRARGLRRTSSSDAVTTFFVSAFPAVTLFRNLFFTIRSSSEWKVKMTRRPPERTVVMEESIKDSSAASSSFT